MVPPRVDKLTVLAFTDIIARVMGNIANFYFSYKYIYKLMTLLRETDSKLYRLISKKIIYFLTTLFFASIPSLLISCELQTNLNIRNVILERTNAPINTLIEVYNGEISFFNKRQ